DRGRGIEDLRDAGEDSISLINRGNRRDAGDADQLPNSLVVTKKEKPIVKDGSTEGRAKEIAAILRLLTRRREVVSSVQRLVAKILIHAAVKSIRSCARGHVHHASVEPTKFSRNIICLDCEFLNVIENREIHNLARFRLQGGNSVIEVLVG